MTDQQKQQHVEVTSLLPDSSPTTYPKKNDSPNHKSMNYSTIAPVSHEAEMKTSTSWFSRKMHNICPPQGMLSTVLTVGIVLIVLYACLFSLIGAEQLVPPKLCDNVTKVNGSVGGTCEGGLFFGLYLLFLISMLLGYFTSLTGLPPLLGMLVTGTALKNIPYLHLVDGVTNDWSIFLRSFALCIILLKAGLGLDPVTLRKLSGVVLRLAFTPCLVEALVAAISANLILGLPWLWAFMLGFVLAAVSPAVVVPCMLNLEAQGFGVAKGIPTLIIAAASVDDVLAITGFGIVMAMTFSTDPLWLAIIRGPMEAVVGVVYGVVTGVILWYNPSRDQEKFTFYRFLIFFALGLIAIFGSGKLHLSGAGPLGCLTVAFVAGIGWRRQGTWKEGAGNPILKPLNILWWLAQPFLFSLIGAEIKFASLQLETVGKGLACLVIGLMFRMAASFFVVFKTNLSMRERFFIPLAWLPKATVQAAFGSLAYDMVRKQNGSEEHLQYGSQILTIAVLSIILTAPFGAALISISSKYLLSKTEQKDQESVEVFQQVLKSNGKREEAKEQTSHL